MPAEGDDDYYIWLNNSNDDYEYYDDVWDEDREDPNACPYGGLDSFTPLLVLLQIVICVLAVAGNSVLIFLIRRSPVLKNVPNNVFVVGLAVADIMVGLNIPYYISFYFDVPFKCSVVACEIRYIIALYVTLLSVLLMLGVSVDRYLSVVHAMKYQQVMRLKLAKIAVLVFYVYVAVIVVTPYFFSIKWEKPLECDLVYLLSFDYTVFVILAHISLSLVVTICLYVRIFHEAWHQLSQVIVYRRANLNLEMKIAKTMLLILGVQMLGLVPYLFVATYRYFEDEKSAALSIAKKFVVVLYYGKSAANPIIYAWKNKDLRKTLMRHLAMDKRTKRTGAVPAVPAATFRKKESAVSFDQPPANGTKSSLKRCSSDSATVNSLGFGAALGLGSAAGSAEAEAAEAAADPFEYLDLSTTSQSSQFCAEPQQQQEPRLQRHLQQHQPRHRQNRRMSEAAAVTAIFTDLRRVSSFKT